MAAVADKTLENGLTLKGLARQAFKLFALVFNPEQAVQDDDVADDVGFQAVTADVIRMAEESEEAEQEYTVPQLGERLRLIYLTVNQLGDPEVKPREMKAWNAVARYLFHAVESDESEDAAASFDLILQQEQQETADV